MREHIANPGPRLDVVSQGGWEEMQWERSLAAMDQQELWKSHRIDTSELDPTEVAKLVTVWIRQQIGEQVA